MTTDEQTPIPYVQALSSQFAELERDTSRRSKARSAHPRPHRPRTARSAVLIAVLALVVVSGAAAATGTLDGLFPGSRPLVTRSGGAPSSDQPARPFGVFSGLRSSADDIDADGRPESVPGAATARRLNIDPSLGRAWVSRDKEHICLTVVGNGGSGTSCGARSFALANGIVLTIGGKTDDDQQLVVGVVPDGVDEVTLNGSRAITVPVHGNAYATLAGDVRSQEFQHDGTTIRVRLR